MHRRTVAPEKPRAAATATLRIEALAAEPLAKPFGVRSIGKAENADRRCHTVFDNLVTALDDALADAVDAIACRFSRCGSLQRLTPRLFIHLHQKPKHPMRQLPGDLTCCP